MWVKPVFSGWDRVGTLISKFEYKSWDIDNKNITVSHCDHTKCISMIAILGMIVDIRFCLESSFGITLWVSSFGDLPMVINLGATPQFIPSGLVKSIIPLSIQVNATCSAQ